ncbi:MAG: ribose 5-phosphate isomerase B [Spirochaetia bacterium]|nr:ribose 5-phosphate isomerase B [Spirochaetia bacterium]
MKEKVVVGCDHGAFKLKEQIKIFLIDSGYDVFDAGVYNEERSDYPDIAKTACTEFLKGGYSFGILCCGTGIGISIAANKIKGIRCALIHNLFTAEMCKAHNNANFIAFGGRINYAVSIESMITKFIKTEYERGRHDERLQKLRLLE